jgi:hypothetical protein
LQILAASTANFGTIDAPVINKHPTLNHISIRYPNGWYYHDIDP